MLSKTSAFPIRLLVSINSLLRLSLRVSEVFRLSYMHICAPSSYFCYCVPEPETSSPKRDNFVVPHVYEPISAVHVSSPEQGGVAHLVYRLRRIEIVQNRVRSSIYYEFQAVLFKLGNVPPWCRRSSACLLFYHTVDDIQMFTV